MSPKLYTRTITVDNPSATALDVSIKAQVINDDGPSGGYGPGVFVHLARHRGRRAGQPSCRGDVPGRDRRDRTARGGPGKSAASVHEAADGGSAGAGSRSPQAPARALHD